MLPPDLILHSGKIITLDARSRLAQAISVRSGHVAAVGDDAALLKDAAPTTRLIDLEGRSVLPGFFDAHPHADREGLKARGGIPIAGLHSVAASSPSSNVRRRPHPPASGSCSCPWASRRTSTSAGRSN